MLSNTRSSYGLIAQLLHWATAALILTLIPLGVLMNELPGSSAEEVAYKAWFYSLHKTLGVTALFVAVLRVVWVLVQPHPKPLNADRKLESLAAQTVHWMLYGAIILMPLTGWLHHSAAVGFAPIWWPLPQDLPLVPKSPALSSLFGMLHFLTAILLGLSVFLHVAGALKHTLVDRDATLWRMIPGSKRAHGADVGDPHFKRLPSVLAVLAFLVIGALAGASFLTNQSGSGAQLAGAGQTAGQETGWQVDPEKSRLGIQIVQMGNAVSGSFKSWTPSIVFDPENPEAAKIEVVIDVASIELGGVSNQALTEEFLNAAAHPVSRFVTTSVVSTGENAYEAGATLSLAGTTAPVSLPFTLKIEGTRAFVEGEIALDRLAFGIGKKGFSGNTPLGHEVLVKINLEAEKQTGS